MSETLSNKLAQDLDKLLDEITEENLADMSFEEISELRKKVSPYGVTIEGSGNYLTFSFTNLTEKYLEKLLMTSMIGYLNRALDEWNVPDDIPVIPVADYMKNPECLEEFHKDWKLTDKLKRDIDNNREWMKKRAVVKEFLNDMFQYNPDVHVRSAYRPQPKDVDRSIVDTPAANLAVEMLKKKDAKFRENMLEFDRVQKIIEMRAQNGEDVDEKLSSLIAKKLVLPEYHYYTMDFEKWSDEDKNLLNTVCNMIPPVDIFHKFRNYMESNYDKLREAVQYLYCEKPDFDMAINPYSWHETEEEASEFQKKHRNEVIADIFKAQSGKWNLFAPFAKVRNTTKYFNEKTIVLEEMMEQIERDARLAEDLMKNRVKQKKKKNIKEEGPDAERFRKWKEQNSTLKDMGAVTLKPEDLDSELPDDAVQVDVFKTEKGKMKKERFYTKAKPPELPKQADTGSSKA